MTAETTLDQKKMAVNRREFLNIAWLASLGFFTISLAGVRLPVCTAALP